MLGSMNRFERVDLEKLHVDSNSTKDSGSTDPLYLVKLGNDART